MLFNHIHHALAQVQELRQRVLESRMFRGYSGTARAMGGTAALTAALVMSLPFYPQSIPAHVFGWGAVCLFAFVLNFGAVGVWYYSHDSIQRENIALRPVLDPLPALAAGGIITSAMLAHGAQDLLFGTWMCLFGVMNLSSRLTMPRSVAYIGWYYLACGAALFLLLREASFTNPWPMGLVFFAGEIAGSAVFHNLRSCSTKPALYEGE